MAKARVTDLHQRTRGRLLFVVVFLLVLYVIVPRIGSFSDSIDAIRHANQYYVLAALASAASTYLVAAAMYQCLAMHRLLYRRTLLVQIANGFANRLLPAGLGGLTLSVQYLKKSGHTLPQALAVAGMNNTLGFIGHLLLLAATIVLSGDQLLAGLKLPHVNYAGLIGVVVIAALVVNLLAFQKLRRYVYGLTVDTIKNVVMSFRKRPAEVAAALLLSVLLTTGYVLTFYLCCIAVGIELAAGSIFAIFTAGMVATTATPTPGGLGGAEAGLIAGLAAYGIGASTALASVLLYRLLTYWLPMLPGFIAFLRVRKQYL